MQSRRLLRILGGQLRSELLYSPHFEAICATSGCVNCSDVRFELQVGTVVMLRINLRDM